MKKKTIALSSLTVAGLLLAGTTQANVQAQSGSFFKNADQKTFVVKTQNDDEDEEKKKEGEHSCGEGSCE